MPNGPTRKNPAWRSSSVPNTLGESKAGTHSQSIAPSGATSAEVWQFDRNAYSAIGGKGDGGGALLGGDARGAGGGEALWGGHPGRSASVRAPPTARPSVRARRAAGPPPAGPTCP